jgi:hypothetical protein
MSKPEFIEVKLKFQHYTQFAAENAGNFDDFHQRVFWIKPLGAGLFPALYLKDVTCKNGLEGCFRTIGNAANPRFYDISRFNVEYICEDNMYDQFKDVLK